MTEQLLSTFAPVVEPQVKKAPTFAEFTPELIKNFNSAGQIAGELEFALSSDYEDDASFDPWQTLESPEYEKYAPYADSFIDVRSKKKFDRMTKKIDGEIEFQELQSRTPLGVQIAGEAVNAVLDPINWIGVGEVKGAYSLAGRGLIRTNAERYALIAGGTQAANEVISQATLETRGAVESGISIAAAGLLGGTLGGAVGYLKRPLKETSVLMEKELDDLENIRSGGSVGAAQVSRGVDTTLEQETLKGAFGLEKAFGAKGIPIISSVVRSPTLALLNSPSLASRRIAQELAEIPNGLKKFEEGIAAPDAVESLMRTHQVKVLDAARDMESLFRQYRQASTAKIFKEDVVGFVSKDGNRKMTMFEFREAVGDAMINGDKHPIPEVEKAAKSLRSKVFDPLKNDAIDAGLLPEDIDELSAESYFTRVWNQERIAAERPDFEDTAYRYIAEAQANVNQYAETVSKNLDKARALKSKLELEIEKASVQGADVTPQMRKDREKLKRREYRLGIEMARLKDAEKTFNDFVKRTESGKVADVDAKVKDLISTWKSSANIKGPKNLAQFIRSKGGVLSNDVDLTDKIRAGGNLLRKEGKTLDDLGELATEEGYFAERPTVGELIDALEDDLSGRNVYSVVDADEVADINMRLENISEVDRMFTEMGINRDMSPEQIAKIIAESEGKKLKLADGKNKALLAQSGFYERYARRRLEQIDQRVVKLKNEADEFAANVSVAGETVKRTKSIIEDRKRMLSYTNERISRMNKMLDENRIFSSMAQAELRDMATEITENILGMSQAVTHYKIPALRRGPLKERTFHIPNKLVSRWIEKDAMSVAKRYTRSVASDVELTRKFGRADMRDQIQEVSADYVKELEKAKARGASEKEISAITEKQKMDLEHINGIRERLNGTYALPSNEWGIRGRRVSKVITGFNVSTSLGGMLMSSIVDTTAAVFQHGFGRMLKGTMKNFAKKIKKIERPEKREGELAGVIGEAYLNNRAHAITDVLDPYNQGTKLERAMSYASSKSVAITGFNIYTDALREIIAGVSIDRSMKSIEALAKGAKIKPKEIERLAMFGIDSNDAKAIYKQFQKHGKIEDGEYVLNSQMWDDVALSRKWSSALGKEILKANIQPGQEKPLFMSTGLGSVMFQFKSFVAAANQRILIAGLQQRDAEVLQGMVGMIATGMLVAYLRTPEENMPEDFNGWLREGIDRSGILGWVMEGNNIVEKLTGNNIGLSALMGTKPSARYSSRGAMGAVLGPTFGKADDLFKVIHATGTGEFTEADAKRIRRLIPLQNNWYLKGMFDQVEEGLKESLVY